MMVLDCTAKRLVRLTVIVAYVSLHGSLVPFQATQAQSDQVTKQANDPAQASESQSANETNRSSDVLESLWTRSRGDDWPRFLGPTADGKSQESGIITDWSADNLNVLWKIELGEGYGIGSVAKGRYFHFDRHDGQARVRSFNAETGDPLWEFAYPSDYNDLYGYDSGPRASPVIDGNRVYLFGVEGMLYCLTADEGKELWKIDTGEKFGVIQNFFGVSSTPVVFDDLILVMVGGSPAESKKVAPGRLNEVKPNGAGVVALNKFTGEIRYQAFDELASYSTIKLTTLNKKPIALAWMRGSLIAFDPANGKSMWEFPWRSRKLESVNASCPVVVDDHVLISECYEIGSAMLKMGSDSPEEIWNDRGKRKKAMEAHWNTPIVIDGMMYGCSGRHPGGAKIQCVDFKTGDVRWSNDEFTRSSLTYVDGHFVVLDEQGRLLLIKANPDRFEQVTEYGGGVEVSGIEKINFKPPCWAAPVISHGLMYVRGKKQLVCFDLIPEKKSTR